MSLQKYLRDKIKCDLKLSERKIGNVMIRVSEEITLRCLL